MEYGHLKIDANGLAALVTAIGGLILVLKGVSQRMNRKDKKDE